MPCKHLNMKQDEIDSLRATLANHAKKIAELRALLVEVKMLNKGNSNAVKLAEANAAKEDAHINCEAWSSALILRDNEVIKLKAKLKDRNDEFHRFEATLGRRDDRISELETTLNERAKKIALLAAQLAEAEASNSAESCKTITKLLGKVASLSVELDKERAASRLLKGVEERSSSNFDLVSDALKDRDARIKALEAEVNDVGNNALQGALERQEKRIQYLETKIVEFRHALGNRNKRIKALEAILREKDNEISQQLKSDRNISIADLRRNLTEHAAQIIFQNARIRSLKTTESELQNRLNQKSHSVNTRYQEIVNLHQEIVKLRAENKKLKKPKTYADCFGAEPLDLDIQKGVVYKLDKTLCSQIKSDRHTINQLKRTIEVQKQTIEAMNLELAKAEVKITEKCKMVDDMSSLIDAYRDTIKKNNSEIAKLRTANTNLKFVIPDDAAPSEEYVTRRLNALEAFVQNHCYLEI